jgi:hypothetical protein
MDTAAAIENQLHTLQPICSAQRVSTGITCGAPAVTVAEMHAIDECNQMGPRPDGDLVEALPSMPGYCATGDGDLRGPRTRDGVPMRHPPGVHHLWASHSIPAQCLRCAPDRARAAGIMTRLRIASLFAAVVAGAYAALRLIDGQLIDFGVAAAICAGSSVAAGLFAYAGWRRRKAVAHGRAAVWEGRDQQAATAADQQCPLCGGAHQELSDSPRFVDRQGARHARLPYTPEPTR